MVIKIRMIKVLTGKFISDLPYSKSSEILIKCVEKIGGKVCFFNNFEVNFFILANENLWKGQFLKLEKESDHEEMLTNKFHLMIKNEQIFIILLLWIPFTNFAIFKGS